MPRGLAEEFFFLEVKMTANFARDMFAAVKGG
jgi:hypothetical protein